MNPSASSRLPEGRTIKGGLSGCTFTLPDVNAPPAPALAPTGASALTGGGRLMRDF